ncbi:hypothetical protein Ldro_0776 [Legionella drozanskii LLAP-1]|uniref:Uncharacterized protein n=1 Tax=Legionella drozanskii LLAP-1 TaxID=1212489 RepID=A0A0W0T0I2_9GAMM|nr:hypothetical protein Ldro_0776 [Legionella drozanskii LLAP-1]
MRTMVMNVQILLLEGFLQGKNWHYLRNPLLFASAKNEGLTILPFIVSLVL